VVDGIRFASKREANDYGLLKIREKMGAIQDLRLQVRYPLVVNGQLICTYIADFVYVDTDHGSEVVADSKGMRTDVYKLKKKLMKAILNIDILEL